MALKVRNTSSGAGFIPEKTTSSNRSLSADLAALSLIEAYNLAFNRGQVIRLIATAGDYDEGQVLDDLRMARWYLDREIARIQRASSKEVEKVEQGESAEERKDNPG